MEFKIVHNDMQLLIKNGKTWSLIKYNLLLLIIYNIIKSNG